MMLNNVKEFISSLGISENVFVGPIVNKAKESVGVYNCKQALPYEEALSGCEKAEYGIKCMTILVHWNKSFEDTKIESMKLLQMLCVTNDIEINGTMISSFIPLVETPIDVGTDEEGICETVLEVAVIYKK